MIPEGRSGRIDNEESVSRCKERRNLMKEAVVARNAFASFHSSYAMALKNAGAALTDGHGESQGSRMGLLLTATKEEGRRTHQLKPRKKKNSPAQDMPKGRHKRNAATQLAVGGGDIGGNEVAVVKQHRAVNQIIESLLMHILGLGLLVGLMVHLFQKFKGFNRVDAFYAAVVTITTVGYGDKTPSSKEKGVLIDEILQTCILIAVRYFLLHTTLGGILDDVCDLACHWNWVDTRKRTIGLILSLVSLGIFIGGGAFVISIIEEKNWKISIYHSMTSISTVGYGDQVFTKEKGKIFAIIWLLLGVPICEKSVGFLHQLLAKWRTLLASFIGNVVWTVVTFVAKAFWMHLRLVGNLVSIVLDFWFTWLLAFGAFLWVWYVDFLEGY